MLYYKGILLLCLSLIQIEAVAITRSSNSDDLIDAGQSYLNRGEPDQAIFLFTRAIEESPQTVRAYVLRAEAYLLIDRYHLAYDDLRRAIALDPQYLISLKSLNRQKAKKDSITFSAWPSESWDY